MYSTHFFFSFFCFAFYLFIHLNVYCMNILFSGLKQSTRRLTVRMRNDCFRPSKNRIVPQMFHYFKTLIKYRNIQWTIQWIRFGVLDLKFLFYSVIIQNCRKPTNVSKVRQRHGTLVYSRNELVAYISDLVNS